MEDIIILRTNPFRWNLSRNETGLDCSKNGISCLPKNSPSTVLLRKDNSLELSSFRKAVKISSRYIF